MIFVLSADLTYLCGASCFYYGILTVASAQISHTSLKIIDSPFCAYDGTELEARSGSTLVVGWLSDQALVNQQVTIMGQVVPAVPYTGQTPGLFLSSTGYFAYQASYVIQLTDFSTSLNGATADTLPLEDFFTLIASNEAGVRANREPSVGTFNLRT